jgi:phosphate transport system substrate-binding protein
MNREEGSGTRYSFKKIVLKEGEELTRDCLIQHTTGAIKGFVAVNKYAIGYVSLPAVDKTVKVLKIDNLYPTLDNIKKGKYRLKRELFLVTKGKVSSEIKDFIDFCLKEESAKIIEKEGFIAVK